MSVLNRDGFAALVATVAGLDPTNVEWDIDPNFAVVDPQSAAHVSLKLIGLAALGVDEHRPAFDPPGYPDQSYVVTEIGNRDVTINIRAETYDKGIEAAELIDRIRTGIRAQASTDTLNSLLLAFVWATKTTMLPTTMEQRAVSVATADFLFGGIAQEVSSVQVGSGWVDEIDGMPLANCNIPGTFTQ